MKCFFFCSSGSVASWLWGFRAIFNFMAPFRQTFVDINSNFVSRTQNHVENVDVKYIVTSVYCEPFGIACMAESAANRLSAHSMHISFLIVCSRVSPCSTTAEGYKCITQSWTQWKASSSTFGECAMIPVFTVAKYHYHSNIVPRVLRRRYTALVWEKCLYCCLPFMIIMCNFIRDSILDICEIPAKTHTDTPMWISWRCVLLLLQWSPFRFRLTLTEWENISWINKIFDWRHCAGWINIDSLTSDVVKNLCQHMKRSAQSAAIPVESNSNTMLMLLALAKNHQMRTPRKEKPF